MKDKSIFKCARVQFCFFIPMIILFWMINIWSGIVFTIFWIYIHINYKNPRLENHSNVDYLVALLLDIVCCVLLYFNWYHSKFVIKIANHIPFSTVVVSLLFSSVFLFISYFGFLNIYRIIEKANKKEWLLLCCFLLFTVLVGGKETYYFCLASVSVEYNGFSEKQLIISGEEGSYFDASVNKCNNGIELLVSNRKNKSLDLYKSKDGIEFCFDRVLMEHDDDIWWMKDVNRATKIDDLMYFTGQAEGRSYIGVAKKSSNGEYYLLSQEPILSPNEVYEKESVMNPYVIKKDGKYYMYYAAGETYEPDVICLAISEDGINFSKKGIVLKNRNMFYLDSNKIGACEVYENETGYIMYYIGYTDIDTARILYAESNDGINWNRTYLNCVVSPSKEFDYSASYKPTVIEFEGKQYLYYNGRRDGIESICVVSK